MLNDKTNMNDKFMGFCFLVCKLRRIEFGFLLTCLYVDPANALVDAVVEALSFCVLLDFSLTHVTADAVSDALTST